ncbi:MAG TPA: radical SAM family heme chaperone HemW [Kofleriaceae bacterium]|nr:radical SAM family heme chaperone HemW [Kofleriaceae bacterium]
MLGVYIHYPFCRKLCPYCDFAVTVAPSGGIPHEAYRMAVVAELDALAPRFAGRELVSIYFGGGTPSLWPATELGAVIAAVRARWEAAPREVTLEANPRDCTPEAMAGWRAAGIDRLSIGVQSLAPSALATLGRDHHQGDGRTAVTAAVAAGFRAVSADAIIGVPGTPGDDAAAALAVADLGPQHLSVYELTIEPRTHFGKAVRAGRLALPDDDDLAARYLGVHAALTARGFEHYEVSSYARPGFRAVHNSLYWRGGEYLGLGAGAASFRRAPDGSAQRWTNHRATAAYLRAAPGRAAAEHESLTAAELTHDLLWLAMRTTDGAAAADLEAAGTDLTRLLALGLVESHGDRICPTLRGFLYSNQIAIAIAGRHR